MQLLNGIITAATTIPTKTLSWLLLFVVLTPVRAFSSIPRLHRWYRFNIFILKTNYINHVIELKQQVLAWMEREREKKKQRLSRPLLYFIIRLWLRLLTFFIYENVRLHMCTMYIFSFRLMMMMVAIKKSTFSSAQIGEKLPFLSSIKNWIAFFWNRNMLLLFVCLFAIK